MITAKMLTGKSLMDKYLYLVRDCQKKFAQKQVLVLGDLMLDEYLIGKVERVSPEAPVPVLDYQTSKLAAGGAGNVANNLRSLGCKVRLCGVAADDFYGNWLREYFGGLGIDISGVFLEDGRPTTVKQRFSTRNQQLLRVDRESPEEITAETKGKILEYCRKHIAMLDAIVLSDYVKGMFADAAFIKEIIHLADQNEVIIGIDSKSVCIAAFADASFVKPNNLELERAVGFKIRDEAAFGRAGEKYLKESGAKALVVTRGEKGISLFRPAGFRKDFKAEAVQVYDVTGAGDTVISVISLALSCGITFEDAVVLANYAAGVVISKAGTAVLTVDELEKQVCRARERQIYEE